MFDRLAAARQRGASWDGLAAAFAALAVATAAGRSPTGADLRNAYHAERYARGGKQAQASAEAHRDHPRDAGGADRGRGPRAFIEGIASAVTQTTRRANGTGTRFRRPFCRAPS